MLERIGNCRIVEEVASGGMAIVYRAIQDELGRTVAIKALKSTAAIEEHIATRFEREAKSLAALQHENIISVYDFHRDHGSLFIVMEYVSGIDLYDLLDRSGRVPFDVAAIIALQVARALDYIHYRGIVHRDIKPANIMLARQGGVKLMDFGIARDKSFSDLTEAGTGIGTPAYMSPEQILGDKLDARSDLFSLGIVLYQMLTGGKPFVEDEQRSVMHKIRLERHARVRKLNPDIPRELERIVDKCLEKQPRDRWQSAQQVVMSLERFLARYVDINYHARLVMFHKSQGLITQLEADEYVSPLVGVPGHSAAKQPNLQARVTARRGATVLGTILGVLILMLALIHVAPLGEAAAPNPAAAVEHGYLRITANPWADINVDGRPLGPTPLPRSIEVATGKHSIGAAHPWFQPIERTIDVSATSVERPVDVHIDFEVDGTLVPGKTRPPEIP
jgi:eukaryotic-like serine/threonine-protein kinase